MVVGGKAKVSWAPLLSLYHTNYVCRRADAGSQSDCSTLVDNGALGIGVAHVVTGEAESAWANLFRVTVENEWQDKPR